METFDIPVQSSRRYPVTGFRQAQHDRTAVLAVSNAIAPRSAALACLLLAISLGGKAHATDPAPLMFEQARERIRRMLVPSPYKISELARAGTIRYTVSFEDHRDWPWPATAEQRIERNDDAARITICADCGDETPSDEATLRHYLEPNRWVDSDAAEVIAFARAATHTRDVPRQMRDLVDAVRKHMRGEIDFRRYDSASTALRTHAGDCTEFAVLLAAAARARGIPTRLASGIAYSSRFTGQSHVFSPHMWVQAWDGRRWTSYDAGLARFDAGHIAFSVGDGTPHSTTETANAIGKLRIEEAVGVQFEATSNTP